MKLQIGDIVKLDNDDLNLADTGDYLVIEKVYPSGAYSHYHFTKEDKKKYVCGGECVKKALEFKKVKDSILKLNNNKMKITNLVKSILDKDTRKLVKAGFINGDLALTEDGVQELLGLLFLEKKAELVKIADEKIKDENDN